MKPEEINDITHEVIGAAMEVHRVLGPGFLEAVYEEALSREFELRSIPFRRQICFTVGYKEHYVGEGRLDFLVRENVVVELKAVEALALVHAAQTLSYLKATQLPIGLLINFNVPLLKEGIRRIILS